MSFSVLGLFGLLFGSAFAAAGMRIVAPMAMAPAATITLVAVVIRRRAGAAAPGVMLLVIGFSFVCGASPDERRSLAGSDGLPGFPHFFREQFRRSLDPRASARNRHRLFPGLTSRKTSFQIRLRLQMPQVSALSLKKPTPGQGSM